MKIVIDIPEHDKSVVDELASGEVLPDTTEFNVVKAIQNGTPLPKDMQQFDERTMATAFAYAHYMMMLGVNVTEKWDTVTQQSANLEQAYRKGYYDGVEKMMALNRGNTDENSN